MILTSVLDEHKFDYRNIYDSCFKFGYNNIFDCVSDVYFELFNFYDNQDSTIITLKNNSIYFHLRLGDEKADQRKNYIKNRTLDYYINMTTKIKRNYFNYTSYISSIDFNTLKSVLSADNFIYLDDIFNINNYKNQVLFFKEIYEKNVIVVGSMSSNCETVLKLFKKKTKKTLRFIELHDGYY